jgi:hypothetical protein
MTNISLNKALSIMCKCGGTPAVSPLEELWQIYCTKCGAESLEGCRVHYATNSWWRMNKDNTDLPGRIDYE